MADLKEYTKTPEDPTFFERIKAGWDKINPVPLPAQMAWDLYKYRKEAAPEEDRVWQERVVDSALQGDLPMVAAPFINVRRVGRYIPPTEDIAGTKDLRYTWTALGKNAPYYSGTASSRKGLSKSLNLAEKRYGGSLPVDVHLQANVSETTPAEKRKILEDIKEASKIIDETTQKASRNTSRNPESQVDYQTARKLLDDIMERARNLWKK